jgi:AraC-like DNA-binding protein
VKVVDADTSNGGSTVSFWHLRRELGQPDEQRPDALRARFDRYLEVVAARCGYRLEAVEAHLQVGFERVAEPLIASSMLDAKALGSMRDSLDRAAREARTVRDLLAAYRRAMIELCDAMKRPVAARHDRSVRRALNFIDRHFSEPLTLRQVAREAGVTPNYFSRMFRQRERVTFERYVSRLRIERAKQLLASSEVDVARVADICGFNSPQYFSHAFRRALGVSPLEYRRAPVRTSKSTRKPGR